MMTIAIEQAALNLAVALSLSAVIGFERQWRDRLAGLPCMLAGTSRLSRQGTSLTSISASSRPRGRRRQSMLWPEKGGLSLPTGQPH